MTRFLATLFLVMVLAGCNNDDPVAPVTVSSAPAPILETEPPFSPGTENTLVWAAPAETKTDAWEFLIQMALNPDFSGELDSSDWSPVTTHTFTGLSHGVTYHYRVRARDSGLALTEWSEGRASTQDAVAPTAAMEGLIDEQTSLLFDFELAASDESSGIREIELWVGTEGGEPELEGIYPPGPVRFQATASGPHEFYPRAVDGSGNRQELAQAPSGVTLVPEPIIITDMRGEDFDITAAVLQFRMGLSYWRHGLGRGAIKPVLNPRMLHPGDIGYPLDSDLTQIVSLKIGDDARAYGIRALSGREVVDDVVNGVPVAVIYCPLCDAYGTYERVLDGETLTIAASGWTWQEIFVLQDYETGSLWFPGLNFPGAPSFLKCIAGPNQGKRLYAIPSFRTWWKSWKKANPGALMMWWK